MKFNLLLFAAALVCAFVVVVIAGEKQSAPSAPEGKETASSGLPVNDSATALRTFTKEELAHYNGADGKAAYVAVDGIVYDVTSLKAWKKGKHKGRHTAGTELGEAIKKKSPHGIKVLKKLKVVGKVVPSSD